MPEKILGKNPQGVLIRDDYKAYNHLDMEQQSCWAHLLRMSRELTEKENASNEMKKLHKELKEMFDNLSIIIKEPFNKTEREKAYLEYTKQINLIQKRKYTDSDAKKVQTRIINQGINLITAIKYNNIP